jgi:hypothetical protein
MESAMKNAVATAAILGVIAFAASAYAEKMSHDSVNLAIDNLRSSEMTRCASSGRFRDHVTSSRGGKLRPRV